MRKKLPKISIFHQGRIAELDYFQDFKHFLAAQDTGVIIENHTKKTAGKAPWQVIEEAIKYRKQKKVSKKDGDQIWCVFDIDDFYKNNQEKFEKSLKEAAEKNIKIAYSNECFELWFMLHFEQISTAIFRKDYENKLQTSFKKIGVDYQKNLSGIFNKILTLQPEALKRAKKIFKENQIENNPSTSVFLLVEELNKFLDNE
jgi:hypothetical protein